MFIYNLSYSKNYTLYRDANAVNFGVAAAAVTIQRAFRGHQFRQKSKTAQCRANMRLSTLTVAEHYTEGSPAE